MNRRAYLSTLSVTAVPALSGCLSRFDSPEIQLGVISAANYTSTEERMSVRVTESDTEYLSTEVDLPESPDPGFRFSNKTIECEWPEEPGEFVVEAEISDESLTVELATELEDSDEECVSLALTIGGVAPGLGRITTSCEEAAESDHIDDSAEICGI